MSFAVAPPPDDAMRLFLSRTLPVAGPGAHINIHWLSKWVGQDGKPRQSVPGEACETINEAISWAKWADRKLVTDIWVCMSTQRMFKAKVAAGGNGQQRREAVRLQENTVALKSLWLDLDVKPDNFATLQDAVAALAQMLRTTGMPRPTLLVESGYGLHVHWCLAEPVAPAVWAPLGRALSNMARAHGVHHDPQCSVDTVRLLRLPGLRNHKDAQNPRPTRMNIASVLPYDYPLDLLRSTLQPFMAATPIPSATTLAAPAGGEVINLPIRAPITSDDGEFTAGVAEHRAQPINLGKVTEQCGVLRDILERGGNGDPEPLWSLALYAATFAEDGLAWAHKFSSGDPRYDPVATDQKFDEKAQARQRDPGKNGWSTCATFGLHKPSICAACPFNGKIRHPFALGRDDTDLPAGYLRQKGIIFRRVMDENGNVVENVAFRYGARNGRIERLAEGDTLLFTLIHIHGEEREVRIPFKSANIGGRDFVTPLGENGVAFNMAGQMAAKEFILSWMQKLRESGAASEPLPAFGWVDSKGVVRGFAIAGTLIGQDGRQSSSGNADSSLSRIYSPRGAIGPWKAAADFITGQNRPEQQAVLAAAFAGPLVRFTGQTGLLMSMFSPASGVGKSTTMKVAQAVWGHPVDGMQGLNDTAGSVANKMGALRSVPVFWDELHTEEDSQRFVNLAFSLGQGKERARLTSDVAQRTVGTWTTLMVCASNDSILTAMERSSKGGAAGINRVYEFLASPIGKYRPEDIVKASQIIGRTHENFGHAGLIYADWLARQHSKLEPMLQKIADGISAQVQATPEERFWLLTISCLLLGATAARHLGLVSFDLPALKVFLLDTFRQLRGERVMSASNIADMGNLLGVIERYLSELEGRHLLRTDILHTGQGKPRKDAIVIRNAAPQQLTGVTAQLAEDQGVLRFKVGDFQRWLDERRISRRAVMDVLRRDCQARQSRGRIGSGTPYNTSLNTQVMDLDLNTPLLAPLLGSGHDIASAAAE